MRMLKRYPLVQAGNTKPAMTTFSDAIVLRDDDATRKEAIGRFVGDIDDDAHASILHHLGYATLLTALTNGHAAGITRLTSKLRTKRRGPAIIIMRMRHVRAITRKEYDAPQGFPLLLLV